jgi:ASC-1-like (ASCH) protein
MLDTFIQDNKRIQTRYQYRIKKFIQSGDVSILQKSEKQVTTVPLQSLRTFLKTYLDPKSKSDIDIDHLTRSQVIQLLNDENQKRKQRLKRQATQKSQIKTQTQLLQDISEIKTFDPVMMDEDSSVSQLLSEYPHYNLIIIRSIKNGKDIFRPHIYSSEELDIVFDCDEYKKQSEQLSAYETIQKLMKEENCFYVIRIVSGERFLIPYTKTIPKVLIITSTNKKILLISKKAIEFEEYESRLHCEEGHDLTLYKPYMTQDIQKKMQQLMKTLSTQQRK